MSRQMRFLWIDDEPSREKSANIFQKKKKVKVSFLSVKGRDLLKELEMAEEKPEPDLILIDHKLDKVKGIIETGSTAAEIFREKWEECPIVCITGVDIKDIPLHRRSIYEDIIESDKFSNNYASLIAIAKSYKVMRGKKPKNINEIFKLIGAPEEERIRLATIMPEDIKDHFNDRSLLFNISRWVRYNLMGRPGFLYDSLWTATLLGIKERSFIKKKNNFAKAKYKGIFSNDNNERWWQSRMRAILSSKNQSDKLKLPQELGRMLPGITKKDFSVCYVCEKETPETVAYIDEVSTRREQMHLKCTVPHPSYKSSLFFEEIPNDETSRMNNIDYNYPTPGSLISNEIRTIEFLKNKKQIHEFYPKLGADAYVYYTRNCTRIRNQTLQNFVFESQFEVVTSRGNGTCHLGGNITTKGNRYNNHSYFIALCQKNADRNVLIRKFHFDYTASDIIHRVPHPIFHLQYPGELSPGLVSLDLDHQHLCSWLSEPRLCFTPMSLALLINLGFKEFPSENSLNVIQLSEWRDLLRANERIILEPFYNNLYRFITTRSSNQLITNDFYYGN